MDGMPYCLERKSISWSSLMMFEPDEDGAELLVGTLLVCERALELLLVDQSFFDQEISEASANWLSEFRFGHRTVGLVKSPTVQL